MASKHFMIALFQMLFLMITSKFHLWLADKNWPYLHSPQNSISVVIWNDFLKTSLFYEITKLPCKGSLCMCSLKLTPALSVTPVLKYSSYMGELQYTAPKTPTLYSAVTLTLCLIIVPSLCTWLFELPSTCLELPLLASQSKLQQEILCR